MKSYTIFFSSSKGPGFDYSARIFRPHSNAAKAYAMQNRRNVDDLFYIQLM